MSLLACSQYCSCFFFNDTATTEIYTLSLHDALPICGAVQVAPQPALADAPRDHISVIHVVLDPPVRDRKSTRLNSSHGYISYAVFCLKKKKATTSMNPPACR